MLSTKPRHGILVTPGNFLPGDWSVYLDDCPLHEHLNEGMAWNLFKSRCVHFESQGSTVFLKKNAKVIAHQKVK